MSDDFLGPVIAKLAGTELEEVRDEVKSLSDKLEIVKRLLGNAEAKPLIEVQREVKALNDELDTIQASLGAKEAVESFRRHLSEIRDYWSRCTGSLEGADQLVLSLPHQLSPISENPASPRVSTCFDDLPRPLRSCLLYFGIFPDNSYVPDERLYRLWIAEGFVKATGGKAPEEVAKEYLSNLAERNLISRDEERGIGEGKWYKVSDSVHDLVRSMSHELQIRDGNSSGFQGQARRLKISGNQNDSSRSIERVGVRSVFLSGIDENFMASAPEKFPVLEVLDVENSPVGALPSGLGDWLWLKSLSLRNTKVKNLPKSISKLRNLQSLDVRDSLIHKLPNELNKLKKLRHVLAYSYNKSGNMFTYVVGVTPQQGLGSLERLRTLTAVEAGLALTEELKKTRELRWLGLVKCTRNTARALCPAIDGMSRLERLFLAASDGTEILDLNNVSSPPSLLSELVLIGRLERLPSWIPRLSALTGLCLTASRLTGELARALSGLRNLETLQMSAEAFEGKVMWFEQGGFPKLRKLELYSLARLEEVRIDVGALLLLENLVVSGCRMLRGPPAVQHLRHIKSVWINGRRHA